ncbi:MAG: hypothetical protein D3923_13005 [Candidatus Electrothrix sp. AR3]|nr:hypothetical protein [Candidatus Electrothrix sp. AR3]
MNSPDIAIVYHESIPGEMFSGFVATIANDGLDIIVESRGDLGPQMSVEWFGMAAIMAYVSKPYFETILKEMGKDHYQSLKKSLGLLTAEVMRKPKIEPVIVGPNGVKKSNNPYSLAMYILAEVNDGYEVKLLLPKPSKNHDYEEIVVTFMDFLEEYYSGVRSIESIGFDSCSTSTSIIFVHMNPETKEIEWLDWREQYR